MKYIKTDYLLLLQLMIYSSKPRIIQDRIWTKLAGGLKRIINVRVIFELQWNEMQQKKIIAVSNNCLNNMRKHLRKVLPFVN